jgi:hypothetical protein
MRRIFWKPLDGWLSLKYPLLQMEFPPEVGIGHFDNLTWPLPRILRNVPFKLIISNNKFNILNLNKFGEWGQGQEDI